MPRIPLNLGLGSYENVARPFSAQRCVNMYAGIAEAESLNDSELLFTPGIKAFATTSAKKSRGSMVMDGVYYIVTGTTLYSIDSDGNETSLGTITGSSRVTMAHNGEKLAIVAPDVSGFNLWEWNSTTTTLTQVSDVDYRNAHTVTFKDGYYILSASAGDVWFNSALNDPLTYDALDFGTAEMAPDKIVSVFSNYDENEVFVLGEETTEVFQNVGGSGFPFQRIPGAGFEKGSHSKYMPIQWGGFFYFMGGGVNEKTSVYRATGTIEPIKVSTDAIDNEIQKFSRGEIAEAFPFSYAIAGYAFVGFTIRSVNIPSRTFVFNVSASDLTGRKVWFELQTGIDEDAWRANSIDTVYNKLLVSDNVDGRVGEFDINTQTEYGSTIVREKITGPITGRGKSIFMASMELTIDAGQGTITGQGSDPEIMMDFSDDGARTWSSEFKRKMGKIGEYRRRVEWRRLGRIPENRVFRFRVSDPIKVALIKAEAEITVEQ